MMEKRKDWKEREGTERLQPQQRQCRHKQGNKRGWAEVGFRFKARNLGSVFMSKEKSDASRWQVRVLHTWE